jgi:16S rRNA (uracil1498-N3)-methyltransferase
VAQRAAASAQVFVDEGALSGGGAGASGGEPVTVSAEDRHHLSRVLRLSDGEQVVATDGRGHWCMCEYRGGALVPTTDVLFEDRLTPSLTVAFAPPKGDRTEWAVQKLTELGVDTIVPLLADRSVVRWDGSRAERALERLRRVAASAAAQCRRVWLPEIGEVQTVPDLAESVGTGGLASPGGLALAELGGDPPGLDRPVVAVGPEGGWSDAELELGLPTVGLGTQVLRSETAVMTAGAFLAGLRAGTVLGARDGSSDDTRPR